MMRLYMMLKPARRSFHRWLKSWNVDAAAEALTATVNYIVDTGEKIFTVTAAPGGSDVLFGGTPDARQVAMHDGRPQAERIELERDGFRFVRLRHQGRRLLDQANSPSLLCRDGSAGEGREWG